jgi:hypothetical protein
MWRFEALSPITKAQFPELHLLIEQLRSQSVQLNSKQVANLCGIKVVRRGGVPGLKGKRKPKIRPLGSHRAAL